MISNSVREQFPSSHLILLDNLDQINKALADNSTPIYPFRQDCSQLELYNSYIDFALSVYVDKFKQLYACIEQSLEQQWYMIYAQAGRTIIENAATLHHYVKKNEFEKVRNNYKVGEYLQGAISILDRFIRGTRFSWTAFIEGNYDEINKAADSELPSQFNSQTCLDTWYKETPNLKSLYRLLCDLVHPNFGSNILVMRSLDGDLVAGGNGGSHVAMFIICPTLAGIIGVYKTFQQDLLRLESYKIHK